MKKKKIKMKKHDSLHNEKISRLLVHNNRENRGNTGRKRTKIHKNSPNKIIQEKSELNQKQSM